MSIGQILWAIVHLLAAAIWWIAVVLFIAKTVWNFGVPYAMIHEALWRPERKHGWSIFILLDVGLLVIALAASTLAGDYVHLGAWYTGLLGLSAIIATYVHIISVLLLAVMLGLIPKNGSKDAAPKE